MSPDPNDARRSSPDHTQPAETQRNAHSSSQELHFQTPVFSEASEAIAMAGDDDLEWEEWRPDEISFLSHMVAGSMAGLAEHVSLYPVDTIKTHLQCQRCGNSTSSSWSSTMKMIQKEGVFRLWRGVSAMFAGCVPAHAAYFSIFESTKRLVGADAAGHHPLGAALSGATAALAHDMLITPFDVMKQRMQLGYYRDVRHCLREILRSEGVGAFYVAMPTTLLMNIPHGSIVVAVNESMRKLLNPSGRYDIPSSMIAGCTAGAIAAAITTPVDVIKTRLQTRNMLPCGETSPEMCIKTIKQRYNHTRTAVITEEVIVPKIARINSYNNNSNSNANSNINIAKAVSGSSSAGVNKTNPSTVPCSVGSTRNVSVSACSARPTAQQSVPTQHVMAEGAKWLRENLRTVWEVTRKIAKEEGPRGFYRGTIPRVMTQAPAVAISWTAYESVKSALGFIQSKTSTD